MSVLLYTFESWLLSLLGLAWLSLRSLFPVRSFLEEYLIYSACISSTFFLIVNSIVTSHQQSCRAFLAITLIHWLLGVYLSADSLQTFLPSSLQHNVTSLVNTTLVQCCPNQQASHWNLQLYFGGFSFHLIPMAITMAFQTVQLVISSASLINTQPSLWPGGSTGYFILHTTSLHLSIKFMQGILTPPCPSSTITILDNWITLDFQFTLTMFSASFLALGCVDSIVTLHMWPRTVWNFLGLAIVAFFGLTCWLNLADTNTITYPWLGMNFVGFMFIVATFAEPVEHPEDRDSTLTNRRLETPLVSTNVSTGKIKSRSRFVLPIETSRLYPTSSTTGGSTSAKGGKKD